LSGKRFLILKTRRVGGREVLSLFDEGHGPIALPREWTDQAPLSPHAAALQRPPILDALCLVKLRELVDLIRKGVDDAK
jgi:hypothetical protein